MKTRRRWRGDGREEGGKIKLRKNATAEINAVERAKEERRRKKNIRIKWNSIHTGIKICHLKVNDKNWIECEANENEMSEHGEWWNEIERLKKLMARRSGNEKTKKKLCVCVCVSLCVYGQNDSEKTGEKVYAFLDWFFARCCCDSSKRERDRFNLICERKRIVRRTRWQQREHIECITRITSEMANWFWQRHLRGVL